MSDDKERLAAWMMRHGFATGHGDTVEALLEELSWQIAEIKAQRDELREALEELVDLFGGLVSGEYPPDGFTTQPARDAIARAKGE